MKRKQASAGPKVKTDGQGREYTIMSIRMDPVLKRIVRHEAIESGMCLGKYVQVALRDRAAQDQKARRSSAA